MTEPAYLRITRASYDTVAADYAEILRTELGHRPLDRAMLAAFVELVQASDAGPVADIGCGPGRVTGHLQSLGLTARGIDLSPEMIAVARRTHPDLRFDVGSMNALDLEDGSLGGIIAWYSIIHTPPELLPASWRRWPRSRVIMRRTRLGPPVGRPTCAGPAPQREPGHVTCLHVLPPPP
ncbi:methyltransferase domain-containing protein [Streptomyces sp. NBC_01707]|uniref:class I SAM-dependent DNA methyltransferase n=1 Tax=Streptomyces sp. NBC_01707 TaxID=2975914 RepID=UPI00352BEC84